MLDEPVALLLSLEERLSVKGLLDHMLPLLGACLEPFMRPQVERPVVLRVAFEARACWLCACEGWLYTMRTTY